jgi:hypothetical protein
MRPRYIEVVWKGRQEGNGRFSQTGNAIPNLYMGGHQPSVFWFTIYKCNY